MANPRNAQETDVGPIAPDTACNASTSPCDAALFAIPIRRLISMSSPAAPIRIRIKPRSAIC